MRYSHSLPSKAIYTLPQLPRPSLLHKERHLWSMPENYHFHPPETKQPKHQYLKTKKTKKALNIILCFLVFMA